MKKAIYVVLLLALAVFLTACGTNDEPVPAVPDPTPAATDPALAVPDPVEPQDENGDAVLVGWESNTTPVELSVFLNFSWGLWGMWGEDVVSQRITELTGVDMNVTIPVTGDGQQLSLLIAADDLPDLVLMGRTEPFWDQMIANNQLAELDTLIDRYAPDIRVNVAPEVIDMGRESDGRLMRINNFVEASNFMDAARLHNGLVGTNYPAILVRQDYFEAIGSPQIGNATEFMEAIQAMSDISTNPHRIPFYGGDGAFLRAIGPMASHFGIHPDWYEMQDGTLGFNWRNPRYVDALMWMNEMATRGLLTRESFVDDSTIARGRVAEGLPIAYTWTLGETARIPDDNPDTTYMPLPPWDTHATFRHGMGWMSIGISASSQLHDRAIKFLDFTNSRLGATTIEWGVEGPYWSVCELHGRQCEICGPHFQFIDGRPVFHQDYFDGKLADWGGFEQRSGLGVYSVFMFDAINVATPTWIPGNVFMEEMNTWFGDRVNLRPDLAINIPGGTDEAVIRAQINDLLTDYMVRIVFESNPDTARALFDSFVSSAEAAGAAQLEEWVTANWNR